MLHRHLPLGHLRTDQTSPYEERTAGKPFVSLPGAEPLFGSDHPTSPIISLPVSHVKHLLLKFWVRRQRLGLSNELYQM